MKFEEIFKEDGLYRADSFRDGVAFKISGGIDRHELSLVTYTTPNDLNPRQEEVKVYEILFQKDYKKVFTIKSLFPALK